VVPMYVMCILLMVVFSSFSITLTRSKDQGWLWIKILSTVKKKRGVF
jgi:hypothetical protein